MGLKKTTKKAIGLQATRLYSKAEMISRWMKYYKLIRENSNKSSLKIWNS